MEEEKQRLTELINSLVANEASLYLRFPEGPNKKSPLQLDRSLVPVYYYVCNYFWLRIESYIISFGILTPQPPLAEIVG